MASVNRKYLIPFVGQGNDDTACWVACIAMLMHYKQGQTQRMRESTELISMFRAYLANKQVNIPGTIQPADITRVANAMGLRVKTGTSKPADLAELMSNGPVAIFGQYWTKSGPAFMHATVAYKLSGNLSNTAFVRIHGFDPQSSGAPYKKDFIEFHDPTMPAMSVCQQIDYFMYC